MSYYVVSSPAKDYVASTLEQALNVQQVLALIGITATITPTEASLDSSLSA